MNTDANPVATLVWTFALMSLFAVGGANSAIPEMHRIAVDVVRQHPDSRRFTRVVMSAHRLHRGRHPGRQIFDGGAGIQPWERNQ